MRKSYERYKIAEIRQINRLNNPIDAIIKISSNRVLKKFVNLNKGYVQVEE